MKTLAAAALIALGLMAFSPVDSFAGSKHYNNNHNGNNGGEYCPPENGNNHAVPEPGTLALLGAAFGAIYFTKKKVGQ
ncbi:hypothetical protein BAC1_02049 [uncultured bacterium]|nr:hypothetical protein BAC1_02049 [uncultured bacterium]